MKAGDLREFVEDLLFFGTIGAVVALANRRYQFSSAAQAELPP